MKRRRIRGSKGPFVLLFMIILLCGGAVFIGKFVQDNFMGIMRDEFGMQETKQPLPPNPANKPPQM